MSTELKHEYVIVPSDIKPFSNCTPQEARMHLENYNQRQSKPAKLMRRVVTPWKEFKDDHINTQS